MLLSELFQPVQIQWTYGPNLRDVEGEAKFNINGKTYMVAFNWSDDIEGCDVFFDLVNDNGSLTHEITNTGDAGAVFGGVMTAVNQFCQQVKPFCIRFSSKEPSRTSLYAKLIKRFAPKGSEVSTEPGFRGSTNFIIKLKYV